MGVLSERKAELMKKVRCVLSKMGDVVYQCQTEALELTGERCEMYGIALPERKRWLSLVKREDALRKKIIDLLKRAADLRPLYVHIMGRSRGEISCGVKAKLNAGKESARASQCQTEALELTKERSELHGIALPEKERCSGLMEHMDALRKRVVLRHYGSSHIERSFLGKSAGGVKKGKVNVGIQVDMEVAEKVDLTLMLVLMLRPDRKVLVLRPENKVLVLKESWEAGRNHASSRSINHKLLWIPIGYKFKDMVGQKKKEKKRNSRT
ncbi:uncharacterized protein LOC143890794 [Tasmannia lanceolata]|uniref:uncharacterized protein LOC143890794 n=1 Tax=Tasmannia lanceolata TaxID=3420 RepID=UPI00406433F3